MPHATTALGSALAEQQFRAFFQPLMAAHSRAVAGVEALVRWQHPKRGLLAPDAFLPAMERTRRMADLTDWVLRTGARTVAEWHRDGVTVPLSVNLSATLVGDPALVTRVLAILEEEQLPTSLLTLEVTETALGADPVTARRTFQGLRENGVRISVDDFGTGYTSLSALRDQHLDEVKIDRSFVSRIRESSADVAVVRAVRELGHRLGLQVVAEGVEDEITARMLESIGCDLLQGYCFAQPQPAPDVLAWIRQQDTSPHRTPATRTPWTFPAEAASSGQALPPIDAATSDAADHERNRVLALDALDLVDSGPEEVLDDLVQVAATLCGKPIALINLVGADRQWTKAIAGLETVDPVPRDQSFCTHAIQQPQAIMEIPDAIQDTRFATNPFVTGEPHIRFYAGAPLVTSDGYALGSLCVLDTERGQLTSEQRAALERLSRVAVQHMETSRSSQAFQQLSQAMSRLSRIHAVGDIPAAAELVTEVARELLRADGVSLLLKPAPGAVVLETAGASVTRDEHRDAARQVVLDNRRHPASARAAITRQTMFYADARSAPELNQELAERFDVGSLLYVPVGADDSSFGVLAAWWTTPQPSLPPRATEVARTLADETGTTLSRLYALSALRNAAETDPLTGLLNRSAFSNALTPLPAGSSVIVLDLDHFKDVNDDGGHQAGDEVLRSFAAQLRAATHSHDLVGRWGGDEFVIALPGVGADGASAMLRRLRHLWDRSPSFSSGFTTTASDETAMAALHRADAGLYQAKEAGRDQDAAAESPEAVA